jgi:hypothetical protein
MQTTRTPMHTTRICTKSESAQELYLHRVGVSICRTKLCRGSESAEDQSHHQDHSLPTACTRPQSDKDHILHKTTDCTRLHSAQDNILHTTPVCTEPEAAQDQSLLRARVVHRIRIFTLSESAQDMTSTVSESVRDQNL